MRIAVFSDIHANLEALEAVMVDVAKQQCDQIICLGDIVGYGPNPSECLRLLSDAGIPCMRGNHDEACSSDNFPYRMNSMASAAVLWTQQKLSRVEKFWLNNLPLSMESFGATFVHASPYLPEEWNYIVDGYEAGNAFGSFTGQICFVGHTHESVAWIEANSEIEAELFDRMHLLPERRYVINVGSVGQPRDRDPRAAYVVYDTELKHVDLRRIEYPIEKTQGKILAAGLPTVLAQRLEIGR